MDCTIRFIGHNAPSCKRWTDERFKDKIMIDKNENNPFVELYSRLDKIEGLLLSLQSKNTEGVSDDLHESGVLHDVRKWNATRSSSTEVHESSVEGALGKRTECENKCPHTPCNNKRCYFRSDGDNYCTHLDAFV